ncbi:aminomethyl-transferring glycine dehydrogenase subunit GcvPB [candidate division KSB1 bacterium]
MSVNLIFESSEKGKKGYRFPKPEIPIKDLNSFIPEKYQRKSEPDLPEISEIEVARHFIKLSVMNHHVDKGFYPLGSCTMKYNPKINEDTARLSGFSNIHPLQDESTVQGALMLMKELESMLAEVTGLDSVTLQPAAGSHGELTAVMVMRRYHEKKGNARKYILIPDSAHGTNPASVVIGGYQTIQVKSDENGMVDIEDLKSKLSNEVAGMMLTNPNTLGVFENNVKKISDLIHQAGGVLYMDGANMNALMGICKPGEIGFDIVHLNLHKTFSTPHGGGGPGSGPICVKKEFEPFLPVPRIVENNGKYSFSSDYPDSIGKIHSFYGNFGILVRAYTYIKMLGKEGLKRATEYAVLNANYLRKKLDEYYELTYKSPTMHEFVLSGSIQKKLGVKTVDIAKRLLDFGIHAPTIYFPLIVKEALMIEPTETESLESLNEFISVMIQIAGEAENNPDIVKNAPQNTPVGRLDEIKALRQLNVKYKFNKED